MTRAHLWFVLGLLACGAENPIVGTWNDAADQEVYTFNSNKSLEATATAIDGSTGCTIFNDVSGRWSTSGDMVSTTLVSGTVAMTGCGDPSMNMDAHPDISLVTGTFTYSYVITGDTLIFTKKNGDKMLFTRQ